MTRPPLPWEGEGPLFPEVAAQDVGEAIRDVVSGSPVDIFNQAERSASASVGYVHDLIDGLDLAPAKEAIGAAIRAELDARMSGAAVDVTTSSVTGHEIKLSDAKNRATRTLFQNLSIDVVVALTALVPTLTGLDMSTKTAWTIIGLSVLKTIIAVLVSYVSRLAVEPVIATPVAAPNGSIVQLVPTVKAPKLIGPHATG